MRRNFGAALTPTSLGANLLPALQARNKQTASRTYLALFWNSEWSKPSCVPGDASSKDALCSQDTKTTIHVPEFVCLSLQMLGEGTQAVEANLFRKVLRFAKTKTMFIFTL